MPWSPDDIADLSDRLAVVTGANSGLGLETARELARAGAHVVMAVRDQEKALRARASIADDVTDASIELRELDLASLDSVRSCAEAVAAEHSQVDILVNNAGVMAVPEQTTEEGFEKQLGVNHLGHFVLTARLLPRLLAAPQARIVTVTSFARLIGRRLRPDAIEPEGFYEPWLAYGRSKLANLHFALELDRRLEEAEASARSVAAHPGFSNTDLQARSLRESDGGPVHQFWHRAAGMVGMSPSRGAHSILRAATDPEVPGGDICGPRGVIAGPAEHRRLFVPPWRRRAAEQLWELSEEATGESFDVEAMVRAGTG